MDGDAEALEFVVPSDSAIIGTKLKDLQIKSDIIIAGIIRGRETIIPTGEDALQAGDHVIVVAAGQHLMDLADILR